ncbi:MAG: signal peptide peptidase SppA [Vampirovibrionia bacterium]
MKKEALALALIIVCSIGALVGLVSNFSSSDKADKSTSIEKKESTLSSLFGGQEKMAVIRLNGVISDSDDDSDFFMSVSPALRAKKYITKATDDDSVKGVLIRINSPGGTVGASQEVYNAIMRCRKKKPVVVSMGDVAASGGYYIASASDIIVANPGTLTGSIGVIFNTMNFTDLMQKVGVKSNVVKSGKFKDIGSGFRPMTEDERKLLLAIIDENYEQFVSDIIKGRIDYKAKSSKTKSDDKKGKTKKSESKVKKEDKEKKDDPKIKLTEKTLREYADGRIMTGQQAYQIGLVDELGGSYKAEKELIALSKKRFKKISDDIEFIVYDKPQSFSEMFVEISSKLKPEMGVDKNLPFSMSHPNQPLWIME